MTPIKLNIPTDRKFDVIGFGTNAVDHLIRVPYFPEFNSKVEIIGSETLAGGEIASTMVGLQRLGSNTAYAGRFGSDEEGKIGLASLIDEGVDISAAETINGARTQIAYIVIDEHTGERTIMWRRDRQLAYLPEDAPVHLAAECKVLHMTPHDTAACIKMARAAREAGTIVSLDLDNNFDGLEELLPLVDVCIISSDFPSRFFGMTDIESALGRLADEFGSFVVGCTLGAEGALFHAGGELLRSTGFEVPGGCVDTTGAGDAFRAGFIYGLLSGYSLEAACATANKVAALKCRRMGARNGLPTLDELRQTK
ncbi:MAG: carbohydrate kinase family protein [Acidobacteria bacterium]|nr:carbohydrate kinase family protein [Acidobacteriota bacterium]